MRRMGVLFIERPFFFSLQESVRGVPLTAEQRPLFFRHPVYVPKSGLTDEEHADIQRHEASRAKKSEEDW